MDNKEQMQDFLSKIGIHAKLNVSEDVETDGETMVMDIADSNKFGAIYSKLDKAAQNGYVEEDPDSSNISYDSSSIQFVNDDYTITLLGDMKGDTYRLAMRKN